MVTEMCPLTHGISLTHGQGAGGEPLRIGAICCELGVRVSSVQNPPVGWIIADFATQCIGNVYNPIEESL